MMTPPEPPRTPITKARAQEIALKLITTDTPHDFVIMEEKTVERPFGWVFFYNTRQYLKTRDPNAQVPGATPVVVLRDGKTDHLPSSIPPARAIEIYEKRWEEKQAAARPKPK